MCYGVVMFDRFDDTDGSFWESVWIASLAFAWLIGGGAAAIFTWREVGWFPALLVAVVPTAIIVVAFLMDDDEFSTWPN